MSYIQKDLLPGERIVYTGKLHWFLFAPGLSFLILSGLLFFFSEDQPLLRPVSSIIVLWALYLLIKAFIIKISTELAVTNKRIIFKRGLISRDTMELNHAKIESIREEQGVLDRMFDCGTLVIEGTGGGQEVLRNIDAPLTFKKQAQAAADPAAANAKP